MKRARHVFPARSTWLRSGANSTAGTPTARAAWPIRTARRPDPPWRPQKTERSPYRRLPSPSSAADSASFRNGIDAAGPLKARYHSNFTPSWICLDVVAVEVTTPAVGEGPPVADAYTTGFGVLKFVWLNRLKISARNCRLNRSRKESIFASERSVPTRRGPGSVFRPAFP